MSEIENSQPACDYWVKLYLQVVGLITLLAFAAALMPESWMIEIAWWLGIDPFPGDPLTFYLARNLSALYGFVGIGILVLAANLDRYRDLVGNLALGTIGFGVWQLIVNAMAGLPHWWVGGEGGTTILGGAILWWLYRNSSYSKQP